MYQVISVNHGVIANNVANEPDYPLTEKIDGLIHEGILVFKSFVYRELFFND